MTLREKIAAEIKERGPMPFSRYMEMCLYDSELGYYTRHAEQFGRAGDFYTSSDVHAVFGRLLARQFEEMWRAMGSPGRIELLELGPGRGLFALDVLEWSEKRIPNFYAALHYTLAERSPALRLKIKDTLGRHLVSQKASLLASEGHGLQRALPLPTPIIIFANEFFDALPVEVISTEGELQVGQQNSRLVETWAPATAEEQAFLDRYGVHPEGGERVEVALLAQRWMTEIAASVEQGFVVASDYGYTRDEQLAGRHRGTVTAFRQHSASTGPYEAPGEQDITAHVNFTALAAAAELGGMVAQRLVTQSQFLMGIGEADQFAEVFAECRLPQERAKVALQLKHLVTPAGMGESFQVLVASKGMDQAKVNGLSGLSFGRTRR